MYIVETLCHEHFASQIQQSRDTLNNRMVAMFHRSTAPVNKSHVLSEFPKTDSSIRIIFATVAFGMGVDVPDVERVIHWGAPRGLEQFSQESGRAGRDGRQATSVIYFSSFDTAKGRCNDDVRKFCHAEACFRKSLLHYFTLDNKDITCEGNELTPCRCCSNCMVKCTCGECTGIDFDKLIINETASLELDPIARQFNDVKTSMLHDNLNDYRDYLGEEGANRDVAFDNFIMDSIVQNVAFIFCEDDIVSLGLVDHSLAPEILELIEEVDMDS